MSEIKKTYISADTEREDCWNLAAQICAAEEPFDLVLGLTRGGGPVAFYLQEFFMAYWKRKIGYACLRTRSYDDIASAGRVEIGSFDEFIAELGDGCRVLVADDIFDRGRTIEAVMDAIEKRFPNLQLRIATLYYKPDNNEVSITPDYYGRVFDGDEWVVFPRSVTEADGLEGLLEMGLTPELATMLLQRS